MTRKIIWTDNVCACCGRVPYTRRDGREYLYRYRVDGWAVCTPRCDRELMTQAYEKAAAQFEYNPAEMFPFATSKHTLTN